MQSKDSDDPRPVLLYYNGPYMTFINEGIGVITDVKASESNNTLKVRIDEVSFPKASLDNKATAVLMLREEPENIEVFLNGEKTEYTLDIGEDPVFSGVTYITFH